MGTSCFFVCNFYLFFSIKDLLSTNLESRPFSFLILRSPLSLALSLNYFFRLLSSIAFLILFTTIKLVIVNIKIMSKQ